MKRFLISAVKVLAATLVIYLALSQFIYHTAEDQRLPISTAENNSYLVKKAECEKRPISTEPRYEQLDIGPTLHKSGRPASWKSQHMFLGDTCFMASIGPGVYQDEADQDPDYYSIDVEARHFRQIASNTPQEYWLVYYQRYLAIQEIPESFLRRNIEEVVSFNEKTNVVTFEIGRNRYVYQIPRP